MLRQHSVVSDRQQGTLPGSNTGPPLLRAQRQIQRGRPNYVFSLDVRKAFDEEAALCVAVGSRYHRVPRCVEQARQSQADREVVQPDQRGFAMMRAQTLSRRDHGRRGSLTR